MFFAFLYGLYSFFAFEFFHYPARDLGEYAQVVWNLSREQLPESTIKPTPNYFGLYFQPILIFISLIFRFWQSPLLLLIFQSLIVALGGLPVYWLAKTKFKDSLAPVLLMISYLLFFGVQNALAFGFYPISLAASFFSFCLYFSEKKKWRAFFVFLLLSFLCQENVALYGLFLAAYLFFVRKERKVGSIAGVLALVWYFLAVLVLMPKISGFSYPHFVFEPLWRIFWPLVKIKTFFLLFGSVLFLNFFSLPEMILCLPMLFEQFLIARPTHWTTAFHYNISIAPPLFLAAMFTIDKVSRARLSFSPPRRSAGAHLRGVFGQFFNNELCIKRFSRGQILSIFLFAWSIFLSAALNLPLVRMLKPSFFQKGQRERTFEEMTKLVTDDSSVSATDVLAPHLSTRKKIFHFVSAQEEFERKPKFILLGGEKDSWPLTAAFYQKEVEELAASKNYQIVYQREDKYVFRFVKLTQN